MIIGKKGSNLANRIRGKAEIQLYDNRDDKDSRDIMIRGRATECRETAEAVKQDILALDMVVLSGHQIARYPCAKVVSGY